MKKITKKLPVVKKVGVKNSSKEEKSLPVRLNKKPQRSSWLNTLAIGNIIGFVIVLVVNYLAVTLPLGGMTTGALSDLYPNLFVPAALTFSIWGIIYILLLGFVIWQGVDFYKKESTNVTQKIGIWFLLSCVANIGRIFAWQYQQVWLSVIIIIFFLITLIVLSKRVEIGKKIGSARDKYFVQLPISIYLGRLSVATIANITALLVHVGWNMWGLGDIFWTVLVIIVATLLALMSLKKTSDIIFALVIIRAFVGSIIKRLAVDAIYAHTIIWTLGVCIVLIAAGIGQRFEQWKRN